jgi:uncharacterized protein HemX
LTITEFDWNVNTFPLDENKSDLYMLRMRPIPYNATEFEDSRIFNITRPAPNEPTPIISRPITKKKKKTVTTGNIIGAVFGSVVFLAICGAIVWYFLRKQQKKRAANKQLMSTNQSYMDTERQSHQQESVPAVPKSHSSELSSVPSPIEMPHYR